MIYFPILVSFANASLTMEDYGGAGIYIFVLGRRVGCEKHHNLTLWCQSFFTQFMFFYRLILVFTFSRGPKAFF